MSGLHGYTAFVDVCVYIMRVPGLFFGFHGVLSSFFALAARSTITSQCLSSRVACIHRFLVC